MRTQRFTDGGRRATVALMLAAWLGGCSQQNGFSPLGGPKFPWHIQVKRLRGRGHEEAATYLSQSFKRVKGIDSNKVSVYHEQGSSVIGYGRYKDPKDPAGLKDLSFIRTLGVPDQGTMFGDAHFEPIPEPDPEVPAEWRLENSPGHWTLEIARFDQPGRKEAATVYVRHLRSQGVPAYVSFGRVRSIVTVGAFAEHAVRTGGGGRGKKWRKIEPADPQVRKWQQRYPDLLINGQYHRFKGFEGRRGAGRLSTRLIRVLRAGEPRW